ncbi:MAG: 50S ribosomal protein L31e [Ignisphaera sp.]|nr:50S ribosomal protein L31e [Ignisphaera sp.]MCX8168316.1 50S ribosomal protein L31e [Ignisphaera sp.]MDW8085352.1 50S ribosomal protein L31e [Ignisphaera sp.]
MPQDKADGIYIVPLRPVYRAGSRTDRGRRALRYIRRFLERHLGGKVLIDPSINMYMYSRKIERPIRKIAVRFTKLDDGVYKVTLALVAKR